MGVPTFSSSGTASGSATDASPTYPATVNANDIAILYVETANQPVSAPDGTWTSIAAPGVGTAGATDATCLQAFWRRCDGSEDGATVTVTDAGDHQLARIFTIAGCVTSGNPVHISASDTVTPATTSVSIPGFTTTFTDCFIMAATSRSNDSASVLAFSGWANASLDSLTALQANEAGTTAGNGGGTGLGRGPKAAAGAVSATTATGPSAVQAHIAFALKSTTSTGPIVGTASITEADDTVSSAAALAIAAALAATEAGDTLSSATKLAIAATASITEANDTLSSASTLPIAASAAITEAGDTLSATAALAIAATADITEEDDTASSAATITGDVIPEATTRRGRGALKAYVLRQKNLQIEEVAETIAVVPPPQVPQPIVAPLANVRKQTKPSLGPLFADNVAEPAMELAPVRTKAEQHRKRLIEDDEFLMLAA